MMVKKEIDILMMTETKLDDSFPASQFLIQGFCIPFRPDQNKNGEGILLCIRSHITSTQSHKCIIKNQTRAFLWRQEIEKVYGFFFVHIM